jgi:hypothetical protein
MDSEEGNPKVWTDTVDPDANDTSAMGRTKKGKP